MTSTVYFLSVKNKDDKLLANELSSFLESNDFFGIIKKNDFTAIKTHFGEKGTQGYIRPVFFQELSNILKKKECLPFLTETQTLYTGERSEAVSHIKLAYEHGFTYENTGLPIIMADGLIGDEELTVSIPGKIYKEIKLASLIVKAQSLIIASHFTGHIAAGFGAALKNMGMGCASRRGKLDQHSTAKPSVKNKKCVKCGECIKWCPQNAISLGEKKAVINSQLCIGCAECLAVCRFDAIGFNWSVPYEELQKKIVEHAWAVHLSHPGKMLYINFLTRISKDCDCMSGYECICPDIGILISQDPVALDSASLDLVEKNSGKSLTETAYNIPYRIQIDYAVELGFGNRDYEIIEIG